MIWKLEVVVYNERLSDCPAWVIVLFYMFSLNLMTVPTLQGWVPDSWACWYLHSFVLSCTCHCNHTVVSIKARVDLLIHLALSWLLERGQALQSRSIVMGEVTWLWWPVAPGLRRLSPCWSLRFSSARSLYTFTSLLRMIYMTVSEML